MASDVEMLVSKNGNGGATKQQANAAKQAKEKAPESGSSKKMIHYTKDKLMELAAAPLSCKKPKRFVENPKVASLSCLRGSGKPARQKKGGGGGGGGRERSITPSEEAERRASNTVSSAPGAAGAATAAAGEQKKAPADPRERLKAEEDGLVLSPQRRSFTTGCQAPPSAKPKEEEADREIHRELPARRIGSGRIAARDEPRGSRTGAGARFDRFDGRMEKPDHRDRFDEKRAERDRRGGFGRDWLSGPERGGGGGFGRESTQDVRGFPQGGGGRRQRGERPERRSRPDDEPEWFSAGPTSQNDMVELHGFGDESGEPPEEAAEDGPEPAADTPTADKPAAAAAPAPEPPQPAAPAAADSAGVEEPAPAAQPPAAPQRPSDPPFLDDPAIQSTIQHHQRPEPPAGLDLEDILRWDIDSLPPDGAGPGASIGFSRWFRREQPSPPPQPELAPGAGTGADGDTGGGGAERRSSLQDELVGNILNGLELSLKLPTSEPEAYFAPISPAHSGGDKLKGDILSMLQRAPPPQQQQQQADDTANLAVKLAAMGGKTHNVADLEAAVRPDLPRPQPQPQSQPQLQQSQPQPQDSQDAFRRLVSQLRASEAPAGRPSPAPQHADRFAQMLGKAAGAAGAPQLVRPAPLQPGETRPVTPSGPAGHAVTQDNLMKLLHVQQQQQQEHRRREQQQQLEQQQQQQQQQQQMAVHNIQQLLTMQRAASPAPSPLEQLMAIPEARNILIGLQTGRLSRQNLIQQLHNQVLQPRLREIIVAVLRLPQRVSPLPEPLQTALRPAPATQRARSPFQHLGVSAVPAPHRVPSPQEIRVHTQQILQQALIKRKLEEQKENFRKRQENREKSPLLEGPGGADADRRRAATSGGGAPASLAFTPTAVIRNMKSEPRGSPEHRPKGRPLVKTNQDGPPPAAAGAMSAGNIQSVAAKLLETQAQLHHHHHQQQWAARPQQQQQQQQLAANPLARWFSPEMLASAPRADLPPAVQQRVLSVEELERHQVMN